MPNKPAPHVAPPPRRRALRHCRRHSSDTPSRRHDMRRPCLGRFHSGPGRDTQDTPGARGQDIRLRRSDSCSQIADGIVDKGRTVDCAGRSARRGRRCRRSGHDPAVGGACTSYGSARSIIDPALVGAANGSGRRHRTPRSTAQFLDQSGARRGVPDQPPLSRISTKWRRPDSILDTIPTKGRARRAWHINRKWMAGNCRWP